MFRTHHRRNPTRIRSTCRRSPETFKQSNSISDIVKHWPEKHSHIVFVWLAVNMLLEGPATGQFDQSFL
jgi:hypothetical protein